MTRTRAHQLHDGVEIGLRFEEGRPARWMPVTDVDVHDLVRAHPWRRHLTYRGERLDLGIYAAISTGQSPVATDGIWERMELADFDPTVRSMIGQPFKLRAEHGPGKAGYIPDLMLINNDGKITLVDSSPTAGELCPSERVLDWAEEVINARGWTYEWWTGPKDAQYYTNVKALGGFCRPMHPVQQALIEPILALCADAELPIHAVEKSLTNEKMPQPMVRAVIQHLLWWGDLTTDLHRPITTGTRLRTDPAARRPAPDQWDVATRLILGHHRGTIVRCEGDQLVVDLDPSGFGQGERSFNRHDLAEEATALPTAYQRLLLPAQPFTVPR
ncbi:TnsA-like heteromeric transposase endonuclease subunit [Streptomyces lydicus]|uniref:TnsA-like heteromeric transposase endonuclease subunit n=1 Tax=Streptomyces lydicus TaxID=47763 RepID=UPI001F50B708|nr:TnsA-like heteromeric transposase endonuclease subunit [Streptomyces lydicus]MCZ1011895.1 TnsA-like heteromeric transposase endonuclease subunit [Streptomyces lydicus]